MADSSLLPQPPLRGHPWLRGNHLRYGCVLHCIFLGKETFLIYLWHPAHYREHSRHSTKAHGVKESMKKSVKGGHMEKPVPPLPSGLDYRELPLSPDGSLYTCCCRVFILNYPIIYLEPSSTGICYSLGRFSRNGGNLRRKENDSGVPASSHWISSVLGGCDLPDCLRLICQRDPLLGTSTFRNPAPQTVSRELFLPLVPTGCPDVVSERPPG